MSQIFLLWGEGKCPNLNLDKGANVLTLGHKCLDPNYQAKQQLVPIFCYIRRGADGGKLPTFCMPGSHDNQVVMATIVVVMAAVW